MLAPGDYERGAALFEAGRYDDAIAALTPVAREHPLDAQVWKALGVAYAAQRDYGRALEPLQRACRLDPKLADACYFEGRALYGLDRFEESLAVLQPLLASDGSPWRVHLGLAQAAEALGRTGQAEPHFQAAVSLAPAGNPQPGVALAHFLLRTGRLERAGEVLRPLVEAHPDAPDAQLEWGRVLYQLGRVPEAVAHLEIACRLAPANQQARLLLDRAQRLQASRMVK